MNLTLCWKTSFLLGASLLTLPLKGSPWLALSPSTIGRAGTETGFREGFSVLQGNPATTSLHRKFSITGGYTYNEFNQGDFVARADKFFQDFSTLNIENNFTSLLNGVNNPTGELAEINQFLTRDTPVLNAPESGTQIVKQGNIQINWNRFGLKLGNAKYLGTYSMYDNRADFTGTDIFGLQGATFIHQNYDINSLDLHPTVKDLDLVLDILGRAGIANPTVEQQQRVQGLLQTTANLSTGNPNDLSEDSIDLLGEMVERLNDNPANRSLANGSATLNNFTGLKLVHFDMKEAEWSFGFSLFEDHLHITPSLKYLHGRVSASNLKITDPASNLTDILNALEDEPNIVHTNEFDMDLGVLFTLGRRWSFGLATNNLLSPSFDAPTGHADVKLDPTLRIGTAFKYSLNENYGGTIGVDFDVVQTESPIIPDMYRRMFSIGVEQSLSPYLNLHFGTGVDTASRDTTWIFSTGFGVRVSHFFLDTAITTATDSTKIEGERISDAGGYGISLGYNLNL